MRRKYEGLAGGGREFARYASLNVLGMLGLSCYILADTFFVAQGLGTDGLAALNLAIPVYSLIHGTGLMIGMGGGTLYAIHSGKEDPAANRIFTHAVCLAAGFAVCFMLIGLFGTEAITSLFGAREAIGEMTSTYLRMILLFSPAFLLNNVLICFVRNDGAPQLSMAAMLGGSLSNVVLDWVFIFPCGMGIFGAVLATCLAPLISMLILSLHVLRKHHRFGLIRCRPCRNYLGGILASGLPSWITEVSSGVVMMTFNAILLRLEGSVGVAAYGVVANLSLVVIAVYTGVAQGMQPLVSRCCGAQDIAGMRTILRYALSTVLVLSVVIYAGIWLGAAPIAGLFNSEGDPLLQTIAQEGLRLYFMACPFVGWNIVMAMYFTSAADPRPAHLLSLLRGFVLILPLTFLLAWIGQVRGVWCAFPVTELLVAVAGLVIYALRQSRKGSLHTER